MRERVMDYEAGRYAGYGDRDMEKRERLTDEELIEKINGGETACMDVLIERYKRRVRNQARPLYLMGGDSDDLIQEGMIGLFKAVRDYDLGRDASFYTFAELCINRQVYTAVQASKRQKHLPLNTYISLDSGNPAGEDERESMKLGELLADRTELSPEELFLDKERVTYLEKIIEEELSDFERQVLDLYMTGMSYTQIARVLGRDEKATDNALQRLKAKIRKML